MHQIHTEPTSIHIVFTFWLIATSNFIVFHLDFMSEQHAVAPKCDMKRIYYFIYKWESGKTWHAYVLSAT